MSLNVYIKDIVFGLINKFAFGWDTVQCTLYSKDVVFGFVNQMSYLIGLHTSYLVWIKISNKDFNNVIFTLSPSAIRRRSSHISLRSWYRWLKQNHKSYEI